jgi:hypothetical protein
MKSIINFFSDLFSHTPASQESVVAKNSALFISRHYTDSPYLTIVVLIGLVCLVIYLIKKYGGNNEPLRKVPQWTPFNIPNNDGSFLYDAQNFLKSKTFTWVDIGIEHKGKFDEFGSNFQILQYRFNHKEGTYRLMTETRYSDGLQKKQQTYKKEYLDEVWKDITEPQLAAFYETFLKFNQNA